MLHPLVRRTWAPRGQTPTLHLRGRHHRKVSAIGAITISPTRRRLGRYVTLHPDQAIGSEQALAFLKQLRRHLRGPMVVVWDNLNTHRSRLVRAYAERHRDTLRLEFLPPYAPELNPVEYSWSHDKRGTLANACPTDVDQLHRQVRSALAPTHHNQPLLRGFVRASRLPLNLPPLTKHYFCKDQ